MYKTRDYRSPSTSSAIITAGDELLEAETIMRDVVQRRRRVFGPTHPDAVYAETSFSKVRLKLRASSP